MNLVITEPGSPAIIEVSIPLSVVPIDPPTQIVATFADIDITGLTLPTRFIVEVDETNDNLRTTYLFDGAALMWLPMTEA